jgi:predicted lysophospholipase L1 biosynthesis ABC-type transport system permease subunit
MTPHNVGGQPQQPSNAMGLTALILGIASIPLACCFYLGIPLGVVAAVLGFLGKNKADQGLATNRGQAMAGLICGIVGAALGVLLLLLAGVFSLVDLPTN